MGGKRHDCLRKNLFREDWSWLWGRWRRGMDCRWGSRAGSSRGVRGDGSGGGWAGGPFALLTAGVFDSKEDASMSIHGRRGVLGGHLGCEVCRPRVLGVVDDRMPITRGLGTLEEKLLGVPARALISAICGSIGIHRSWQTIKTGSSIRYGVRSKVW